GVRPDARCGTGCACRSWCSGPCAVGPHQRPSVRARLDTSRLRRWSAAVVAEAAYAAHHPQGVGSTSYSLKDTAITHGGLDVLGIRGYVVCGSHVVATRTYLPQID